MSAIRPIEFIRAFEHNCPGVRMTKDERKELQRLFIEFGEHVRRAAIYEAIDENSYADLRASGGIVGAP